MPAPIRNWFLFSLTLLLTLPGFASPQSQPGTDDPYIQTNYSAAFDQRKIWEKYPEELTLEGLSGVLQEGVLNTPIGEDYHARHPKKSYVKSCIQGLGNLAGFCAGSPCCAPYQACKRRMHRTPAPVHNRQPGLQEDDVELLIPSETDPIAVAPSQRQTLDDELISQFLARKKSDAYRQTHDDIVYGCCQGMCLGSLIPLSKVIPELALGAGIGGFVVLQQTTTIIYNVWKQHRKIVRLEGADPLLSYEIIYAVEKRRIPPILWSSIEKKFTEARNNPFDRSKIFEYFTTVFNLPQGKKPLLKLDGMTPKEFDRQLLSKNGIAYRKIKQLYSNIEGFFENYEEGKDRDHAIAVFKTAIRKQVRHSLDPNPVDKNDRYGKFVFIQGSGGLGKTEFVNKLAEWLYLEEDESADKMEDFISLTLISEGADKLLGTTEIPGSLLTGLTKQTSGGRKAPINRFMLVDEAEAINNPNLKASFKALFEPANGIFSSPYLGGVKVPIVENLIFFISNDDVVDPAFEQRVSFVTFPRFKASYLRKYLFEKISDKLDTVLSDREIYTDTTEFSVFSEYLQDDALENIDALLKKKDLVIRDIEKEVEGFIQYE